ncbi:MAG: cell division protein FtsL [Mariprofundaceae bacterium]|nr:cell division protein FtsL [Mariprofundaceae bacterium]
MTGHKLSTILLLGSVALLATAQVWLSHLRYELSLETSRIQKEQSELKREIHQLNLELASLTRPERLRKIAQTDLGMAPPLPMQVIRP